MFSGMTGVVCLPLNQGQVASAGSVTIRTALQCRSAFAALPALAGRLPDR